MQHQTSAYDQATEDEWVSYDLVKLSVGQTALPPNFNQPWTARVNWDIAFDTLPVRISNLLEAIKTVTMIWLQSPIKMTKSSMKVNCLTLI